MSPRSTHPRRPLWHALSLALALLLAAPARASLAYDLDVAALTAQAGLVARAKVVSRRSYWSQDGRRIVTESVLGVRGILKGQERSAELRVVQPGGAVDGVAQQVSGAAIFEPGEEVLVFLERADPARPYVVVGMALGKYRVGVSRESGRLVAFRDGLEDVALLSPDGQPLAASAAGAGVPYSELVRQVEATVRAETR